jgi:SecD/SecF fusion protein
LTDRMPRNIIYKLLFLAALTLLGLFVSIPSFHKGSPQWLKHAFPTSGMRLGLDLQGGMQLLLRVDVEKAVQDSLSLAVQDFRNDLARKQIAVKGIQKVGKNKMRVELSTASTMESASGVLGQDFPDLDLASSRAGENGAYLDIGLKPKQIPAIEESAVSQNIEIIRNRIDQFGVTEPVIERQGSHDIVVQLPGIKDPARAISLIGKTAQLEFKLLDTSTRIDLPQLISNAVHSGKLKPDFNHEELNQALQGEIPPGDRVYMWKRVGGTTGEVTMAPVLVQGHSLMTGADVRTAHVAFGGRFGRPYVSLSLTPVGARIFERITGENVGRELAIILDNVIESAPVIEERISGGQASITGAFTSEQASDLAIVLRAGALPAPVKIVQNVTVGPSLGEDSIHRGIYSAILGGVLVIAFMLLYYRTSGAIADMALLMNLILLMAALSLFKATLTLPGIAGIILSIGMAVDSNVLIFERMREEFAVGKTTRAGIDGGYAHAFWTIIDSHITTLITACALFLFGTGPIKGFAVTLSLGVILNLFTVLYGTRAVYDFLNVRRRSWKLRFLQIIQRPNVDFMRLRKFAFVFSGALVLLGLLACVQIYRGEANLGVEFTGGTVVQLQAQKPFVMSEVRSAFTGSGLHDYELQEVPAKRVLIVRMKSPEMTSADTADRLTAILSRALPGNHFVIQSQSSIGASVSKSLRKSAILAIAISLAGIVVYLAWRFNFHFAVAAAIATFHDVLAVLGLLYLLHAQLTLLIVTALLTLAGYSLTDTVVVFDRIRENLRRESGTDLGSVINLSINEVLSRTIITSWTVFMVLIVLLFLGGLVIHDFALALAMGVIVGTYSSIFVASPIFHLWQGTSKPGRKRKPAH